MGGVDEEAAQVRMEYLEGQKFLEEKLNDPDWAKAHYNQYVAVVDRQEVYAGNDLVELKRLYQRYGARRIFLGRVPPKEPVIRGRY